jgi:hypothetical protein
MRSSKRLSTRCRVNSVSELLVVGTSALYLQATASLFIVDPANLRTLGGFGRASRRARCEGDGKLLRELCERGTAVLTLRAKTTRTRTHHRPEGVHHSLLVGVTQGGGVLDTKRRDDAGQGAIGVLSAGPSRGRHPKLDLVGRDGQSRTKGDRTVVVGPRTARHVLITTGQSHHGDLGRRRHELILRVKEFAPLVHEAVGDGDDPLARA